MTNNTNTKYNSNSELKYFNDFETIDIIKKQYKKNAFKLHPDAGGSNEEMADLNNEYEEALKRCGTINKKNYTLDAEYIDLIDKLIKLNMKNVQIEIVGWFIYITGETKPYRKQLGKDGLGLIWHQKNSAWYYKPKWYYKKNSKAWSMDKKRQAYGSININDIPKDKQPKQEQKQEKKQRELVHA